MDLRAENEDLRRRLAEVEAALREANELTEVAVESAQAKLNAFLVNFADAVRGALDPTVVAATACRLIAEELGVDRAYWAEVDWATRDFVIGADYHAPGAQPVSGRFPLDGWEPFSSYHLQGRPVVVNDVAADPRITAEVLQGYEALGVKADLAVSAWSGNTLRSILAVNQGSVRTWRRDEIALVRSAAYRCWAEIERAQVEVERRNAEIALRESEARLAAAFESVPAGIAVFNSDGRVVLGNEKFRRFLPNGVVPSRDPERGQRWQAWGPDGRPIAPEDWPSARALRGEPVIQGQDMLYTDDDGQTIWTHVTTAPVMDGAGQVTGCVSVISDIDERRRAEAALRASEERQGFLLHLADTLRPLTSGAEIRATSCQVLGEHLSASRVYYVDHDAEGGFGVVGEDYRAPGLPSLAGRYPVAAFQATFDRVAKGEWVVDDVRVDTTLTDAEREFYVEQGVISWIDIPLVQSGKLQAVLCVVQTRSRCWTEAEIELVKQMADRLWSAIQRARAEAALRDSEARFQQFANASAGALWMRDAATLDMEYVSGAVEAIYGVKPAKLLGDLSAWAALVLPEDRGAARAHIERVRSGAIEVQEFRIWRPTDQAFRWVRNTGFPLRDATGRVQRVGGIFEDITEAKLAVEHQGVLLAELQHRVRNIIAMIRSMALRTADSASDVAHYRSLLEGRLMAMARVQVLLTREANAGGSLRDILASEVRAQAHREDQFALEGPEIRLSPKAVEVLTLAVHELATNALKYGAFSVPGGHLRVSWASFEKQGKAWLGLDWTEFGVPPRGPIVRRGFGSDLIEGRLPYELGGIGKITLGPEGAFCRIEFPLKGGESILETGAPTPSSIFGGILDMTDAPDLTGRSVLVVEDDYNLAGDTVAALRGAGAEVLGPCPNEEATLQLLKSRTPTHAVLDLNLGGGGPQFKIARALAERGVPFVFMTGYDPDIIPAELRNVPRLQKPVSFMAIVEAVSQL